MSRYDVRRAWSWADQISVYQFWGLLGFYLFSIIASEYPSFILTGIMSDQPSERRQEARAVAFIASVVGGVAGVLVGWLVTRWKPLLFLATLGAVQAFCLALLGIVSPDSPVFLYVSYFFVSLAGMGIFLSVPAIFAGARSGAEAFVILFGLAWSIKAFIGQNVASYLWEPFRMIAGTDPSIAAYWIATVAAFGLLFLIPVKPSLFSAPPAGAP